MPFEPYDREHTCETPPSFGDSCTVEVVFEREAGCWQLRYASFASAEQVRVGEAEEVGDLNFGATLRIDYCPFCGCALEVEPDGEP